MQRSLCATARRLLAVCVSAGMMMWGSDAFAASTPFAGIASAIPGQINGENFDNGGEGVAYHDTGSSTNAGGQYRSTGVDIEASSEGGYDIGWIAAGEWLNYTVNVSVAGAYTVQLRVASPSGASMHLGFNSASNVWKVVSIPATGGWQNWATVSVPVTLAAGTQQMTLLFDTGGMNYRYANVSGSSSSSSSGGSAGPYSGSPAAVPGTIEAENFDNGADGVAYHDTTPGNAGGQYRNTGVDIEASAQGGYDVGWIAAGEWMNYTVNVASAGQYTVQIRVASPGGAAMHVGFNKASNVWNGVAIPSTGGWQSWATVSAPVTLGAGVQQMTLLADAGGFNLGSITVSQGVTSPAPPPPPSGGGTVLPVIEWNIEINHTETHARQAMDTALATGPQPEVIVVAEASLPNYANYIDELQRQTGRTWYGAFATHCAPGNWNGSSCTTTWDQGVAIFSSHAITSTSTKMFAYPDCWTSARAGLRAAISVGGTAVQVFAMHLQTGGCQNDAQSRYNSMSDFKGWAGQFSAPQLVAGDFNADPDQIDTTSGMSPNFNDSWFAVGTGSRFTSFSPNPTMKIDYWFSDAGGRVQPVTSSVVLAPQSVSDHFPVQATFLVH